MTPQTLPVLPHLRVTWGGTLGVPAIEQWTNTVNFSTNTNGSNGPTAAQLEQMADDLGQPIQAWFERGGSYIGNAARLGYVKCVWIQTNGKQRDVNTARNDISAQGSNPNGAIWEQSYALTLRTAISRGRGHSGRIYPPVSGAGPEGTTPYISFTAANGMATSFRQLLDEVSVQIPVSEDSSRDWYPVVVSGPGKALGPPLLTRIEAVVVDRVADIQHRRTYQVPRLEGATAVLA